MDIKDFDIEAELKKNKIRPLRFAPVWKRVVSFIIDNIVIYIIISLMMYAAFHQEIEYLSSQTDWNAVQEALEQNNGIPDENFVSSTETIQNFVLQHNFQLSIAFFIINAAYFSLGWFFIGQTLGGKIMKIAVISRLGQKLNIFQSLLRYSILALCRLGFYIPLIFVMDPVSKSRIHDFMSMSFVVDVPKDDDEDLSLNDDEDTE